MKSLKFKGERKVHNEFLDHPDSLIASAEWKKHLHLHAIQDKALTHFGKSKESDDAVGEKYPFREAKKVFSGIWSRSGRVLGIARM